MSNEMMLVAGLLVAVFVLAFVFVKSFRFFVIGVAIGAASAWIADYFVSMAISGLIGFIVFWVVEAVIWKNALNAYSR